MFDMSWGEIMVIGGVALIVIGPKDLPKALRTVGQMTSKVRRMAGEFQSQFNEAMREADLQDVRREMEGLNREVSSAGSSTFNPIQTIRDELKGSAEAPPGAPASLPAPATTSAEASATPVEDVGPVPQLEPVATTAAVAEGAPASSDLAPAAEPDAVPLVPLPADEPALPSPDPSRIVTGPGLEPVNEAESLKAHP